MDKKQKIKLIIGGIIVVALLALVVTVYGATTIGSGITTTGTLNVSNNADFTLGASKRIYIDAETTDATTHPVQLGVDAAADSLSGYYTGLVLQGNYIGFANYATVSSVSDLSSGKGPIAYFADLSGRNSASSGGSYAGLDTRTSGSTNNAATYFGVLVDFTSENNSGIDLTGTGNANGVSVDMRKTGGTGTFRGVNIDLDSRSSSATTARGIDIDIDVSGSGNSGSDSAGIQITENGASGTLLDGIEILATNVITDGVDVKDSKITNALNIGTNTILASGDFTIDAFTGANTDVKIFNTETSFNASLILDGGLTIGSTTTSSSGTKITKHLSTTGTVGNSGAAISANSCVTDTITVTGAVTGDTVVVGPPSDLEASFIGFGLVSSTNTVTVRLCNPTTGGLTSGDKTWRVDVWQH